MKGLIFSIEEFAVFDGAGIRVNVFFKGCPLRCRWCHNPEGFEHNITVMRNHNVCVGCGECDRVCENRDTGCILCGKCMVNCPRGALRKSGRWYDSDELAKKLLGYKGVVEASGGGLTFSGGEVLMQADFLVDLLKKTAPMHRIIETSGYGKSEDFSRTLENVDFVYFDLKIMDSEKHRFYTGVSNELIHKNARLLMESGVPFKIRIPFISGVNTDEKNIRAVCEFVKDQNGLQGIELLPYNEMAGAKYRLVGMTYEENFKKPSDFEISAAVEIIKEYGIDCYVQ